MHNDLDINLTFFPPLASSNAFPTVPCRVVYITLLHTIRAESHVFGCAVPTLGLCRAQIGASGKAACTAPGPGIYVCKADTCQTTSNGDPGVNLSICEDICYRPSPPPHRDPHPHHHPPTSASGSPNSSVAPWLIPLAAVVFMVPCTAMWIRYWIRKNLGEAGATMASTHTPYSAMSASEGSTQTSPQTSPQSSPRGGNVYE